MSNVRTPAASVADAVEDLAIVAALMGGTRAMRAAGKAYLPQWPNEADSAYAARLSTATLFPAFPRTVEVLAAKPFLRPITLGDDTPSRIRQWCEDIDLQGRNLHSYAASLAEDRVIETACALWKVEPRLALPFFCRYPGLSVEQIDALVSTLNTSEPEQIATLIKAWRVLSLHIEDDMHRAVSVALLRRGAIQAGGDPDVALTAWLSAQDDDGRALLHDLLGDATIADEQRTRLWHQAISRSETLGKGFFIDLAPYALCMQNSDATSAAIFDSFETIDKLMNDGEARSDLARGLMGRFHEFGTETIKGRAGAMANRLVGNAALKWLSIESLTERDVAILFSSFGPSKEFDRIRGRIHKGS